MTRRAYEVGDKVQWPNTTLPASDSSDSYLTVADRLDTRYASGNWYFRYLYDNMLERIIEDMHRNEADNYDNVAMVAGGEGKGKSNLSYCIAK